MSKFEFLISIVSVLLAVAATEFLASWGRYIRKQQAVKLPPLYLAWSVAFLGGALVHWSGLWAYEQVEFNSLRQLTAVVFPALLLALSVHLMVPDHDSALSLKEQYARNAPRAFPIYATFIALSPLVDLYLIGSTTSYQNWITAIVAFSAGCAAAIVKSSKFDAVILSIIVAAIIWALGFDAGGDAHFSH